MITHEGASWKIDNSSYSQYWRKVSEKFDACAVSLARLFNSNVHVADERQTVRFSFSLIQRISHRLTITTSLQLPSVNRGKTNEQWAGHWATTTIVSPSATILQGMSQRDIGGNKCNESAKRSNLQLKQATRHYYTTLAQSTPTLSRIITINRCCCHYYHHHQINNHNNKKTFSHIFIYV